MAGPSESDELTDAAPPGDPDDGGDPEDVGDDAGSSPGRGVRLSTVVGLVIVAVGVLIGVSPLRDNSFLTHLATGRLILEDGVPRSDPYSFTAFGEPWVVQSWLASVAYASLESLGGLGLVRASVGLLTGAIAGVVWLLTAPARSLFVRLGLAGLVVIAGGAGLWTERPLMVGLLGLGLVLLAAEGRFDPRWVVPVLWVWANAHGSFPFALVVVLLLWAGRRLDGEDAAVERRLALWVVVGMLVAMAGPLGPKVLTFPVELLGRQDALAGVKEWEAPTFTGTTERAFLLFTLVCLFALVRRPKWRAALPFVVFLAASLVAARNGVAATLVFLPGAALALEGLGPSSLTGVRRSRAMAGAAVVLVGAIGLVLVSPLLTDEGGGAPEEELVAGPHLALSGYPVAAVAWLDQQGLVGTGESRLLARDFAGNYLEGLYGTDAQVFVDDRFDMYPIDVLRDHAALLAGTSDDGQPGSLEIVERWAPDAVLWETNTPLSQLLLASDDWGVVYEDDDWLVACPRSEEGEVRCGGVAAPAPG